MIIDARDWHQPDFKDAAHDLEKMEAAFPQVKDTLRAAYDLLVLADADLQRLEQKS